jgi:formimidoylglutamate deiminase
MTRLHFASALLPSGWADDVQVVVADGSIADVTVGVAYGKKGIHDGQHGLRWTAWERFNATVRRLVA